MRTVVKIVAVLACAALLVGPAATQQQKKGRFGGGFGGMAMSTSMLLQNEGVQKELKLTEDQIGKVKEVGEKTRAKMGEEMQGLDMQERFGEKGREIMAKINAEATKELSGLLKPEQDKRVKQILRQQQGIQALQDPDLQAALKLSDEQKENLKLIAADVRKDMDELRQNAFGGGFNQEAFQEMPKKIEGLRKESMDKVTALLNADQKKELKEQMGEPYKLVMAPGFGFGKKKKQQ